MWFVTCRVPTLKEVLQLVNQNAAKGKTVGVAIHTKVKNSVDDLCITVACRPSCLSSRPRRNFACLVCLHLDCLTEQTLSDRFTVCWPDFNVLFTDELVLNAADSIAEHHTPFYGYWETCSQLHVRVRCHAAVVQCQVLQQCHATGMLQRDHGC